MKVPRMCTGCIGTEERRKRENKRNLQGRAQSKQQQEREYKSLKKVLWNASESQ